MIFTSEENYEGKKQFFNVYKKIEELDFGQSAPQDLIFYMKAALIQFWARTWKFARKQFQTEITNQAEIFSRYSDTQLVKSLRNKRSRWRILDLLISWSAETRRTIIGSWHRQAELRRRVSIEPTEYCDADSAEKVVDEKGRIFCLCVSGMAGPEQNSRIHSCKKGTEEREKSRADKNLIDLHNNK